MKKHLLIVPVEARESVPAETVTKVINALLNSGLADAAATVESGEGDLATAQVAIDLNISSPYAAGDSRKDTQVVVFASGGITNSVAIRDLPPDGEPCIVVDYDDRHDETGDISPEDFERKKLDVSREEFDRSATYIW